MRTLPNPGPDKGHQVLANHANIQKNAAFSQANCGEVRRYRLRVWLISCLVAMALPVAAQAGDDFPIGARSLAMGGTYVALANSADAVFLNAGGLSQLTGTHLSVFYQKPFGLPDVDFGTVTTSFRLLNYRVGVGFLALGNSIYSESAVALAFSHQLAGRIHYGFSVKYQTKSIKTYGSDASLGVSVGFVVPLSTPLKLGFQADNINRPGLGQTGERLPQTIKSGIAFTPDSAITLSLEVYKDVRFDGEVRFGIEWTPVDVLSLRAGTANNPDRFSAGFGVKVNKFKIDYAFFTHNDLGLTQQASFSVHLGRQLSR